MNVSLSAIIYLLNSAHVSYNVLKMDLSTAYGQTSKQKERKKKKTKQNINFHFDALVHSVEASENECSTET